MPRSTPPRRPARAAALIAIGALVAAASPVAASHLFVRTSDIAPKAVTAAKIAPRSVTASKIRPRAVRPRSIAPGAVGPAKLRAGAVNRGKLHPDLQPLWAVVWAVGPTISRGSGALSVDTWGVDWRYRVYFDRSVSSCAVGATMSAAEAGQPEQIGQINVRPYAGDASVVVVTTRNFEGVGTPRGFTVQVTC